MKFLVGSRAKGYATEYSDFDYVLVRRRTPYEYLSFDPFYEVEERVVISNYDIKYLDAKELIKRIYNNDLETIETLYAPFISGTRSILTDLQEYVKKHINKRDLVEQMKPHFKMLSDEFLSDEKNAKKVASGTWYLANAINMLKYNNDFTFDLTQLRGKGDGLLDELVESFKYVTEKRRSGEQLTEIPEVIRDGLAECRSLMKKTNGESEHNHEWLNRVLIDIYSL